MSENSLIIPIETGPSFGNFPRALRGWEIVGDDGLGAMAVVSAFSGCAHAVVQAVALWSRDSKIFCSQMIGLFDQIRTECSHCALDAPEKIQCGPAVRGREQLSGRLSLFLLSFSPLSCSSSTGSVIHVVVSTMVRISDGFIAAVDGIFVVQSVWNRREDGEGNTFNFHFQNNYDRLVSQADGRNILCNKNVCLAYVCTRTAQHWLGLSVILLKTGMRFSRGCGECAIWTIDETFFTSQNWSLTQAYLLTVVKMG